MRIREAVAFYTDTGDRRMCRLLSVGVINNNHNYPEEPSIFTILPLFSILQNFNYDLFMYAIGDSDQSSQGSLPIGSVWEGGANKNG